jgi:hypothetical protein
MGSLASNWKAFSVPNSPMGTQIHQTFDICVYLTVKVSLDAVFAIDNVANADDLTFGQLIGFL